MRFRNHSRGASLIETMIAVGILGAISYFVVGMIRNGTVGQKALQVQDDARTMTENMAAILSDPVACAKSLVTVLPPVNPTVGTAVNAINDATGSAAYTTGNVYATKSLKLESIQVGGPGTDAKTGIQKWTPLGSPATSGTAFVQVVWSQVTPGGNSAGPVKLNRFFLVNALSLNGANIATCVAQASGAGGGDSNWTKTSAGYIYNTNTGGVGIGTQTPVPTSVLDVYASTGHALLVSANGNVGIGTTSPAVALDVSGKTDSVRLPSGTTAQRPSSPAYGDVRYNTTTNQLEAYVNISGAGSWVNLGGGGGQSPLCSSCSSSGQVCGQALTAVAVLPLGTSINATIAACVDNLGNPSTAVPCPGGCN